MLRRKNAVVPSEQVARIPIIKMLKPKQNDKSIVDDEVNLPKSNRNTFIEKTHPSYRDRKFYNNTSWYSGRTKIGFLDDLNNAEISRLLFTGHGNKEKYNDMRPKDFAEQLSMEFEGKDKSLLKELNLIGCQIGQYEKDDRSDSFAYKLACELYKRGFENVNLKVVAGHVKGEKELIVFVSEDGNLRSGIHNIGDDIPDKTKINSLKIPYVEMQYPPDSEKMGIFYSAEATQTKTADVVWVKVKDNEDKLYYIDKTKPKDEMITVCNVEDKESLRNFHRNFSVNRQNVDKEYNFFTTIVPENQSPSEYLPKLNKIAWSEKLRPSEGEEKEIRGKGISEIKGIPVPVLYMKGKNYFIYCYNDKEKVWREEKLKSFKLTAEQKKSFFGNMSTPFPRWQFKSSRLKDVYDQLNKKHAQLVYYDVVKSILDKDQLSQLSKATGGVCSPYYPRPVLDVFDDEKNNFNVKEIGEIENKKHHQGQAKKNVVTTTPAVSHSPMPTTFFSSKPVSREETSEQNPYRDYLLDQVKILKEILEKEVTLLEGRGSWFSAFNKSTIMKKNDKISYLDSLLEGPNISMRELGALAAKGLNDKDVMSGWFTGKVGWFSSRTKDLTLLINHAAEGDNWKRLDLSQDYGTNKRAILNNIKLIRQHPKEPAEISLSNPKRPRR